MNIFLGYNDTQISVIYNYFLYKTVNLVKK